VLHHEDIKEKAEEEEEEEEEEEMNRNGIKMNRRKQPTKSER
jgi:hypothetical protein